MCLGFLNRKDRLSTGHFGFCELLEHRSLKKKDDGEALESLAVMA